VDRFCIPVRGARVKAYLPGRYAAALAASRLSHRRPAVQFVIPISHARAAALSQRPGAEGAVTTEAALRRRHPGAALVRITDGLGRIVRSVLSS
jgi:hypothetical protein